MIRGVVELVEDGGEEVLVVCSSKKKKKCYFFVRFSLSSPGTSFDH